MAQPKAIRSVRTSVPTWDRAKARARDEGVSMSHVVNELVEGYAVGAFNLPTVEKNFDNAKK